MSAHFPNDCIGPVLTKLKFPRQKALTRGEVVEVVPDGAALKERGMHRADMVQVP